MIKICCVMGTGSGVDVLIKLHKQQLSKWLYRLVCQGQLKTKINVYPINISQGSPGLR